jgi:hypothetical protein
MLFIGYSMSVIQSSSQFNRWNKSQLLRIEKWKEKASSIHNNKFDYTNVVYTNSHNKVKIICPHHGEFEQRACDHTNQKQGCPKCSHNYPLTHDEFVIKSKIKYNDKFTILSTFDGIKHPITISCDQHGPFTLKKAEKHLERNGGCPTCWYLGRLENLKPGNISKVEQEWLDSLNVPNRQHKLTINGRTFIVDGFDPNTNTVYECYGSFWHGNPAKYKSTEINTKTGTTFGNLYQKTLDKESIIKSHYKLITVWV